MALRKPIATEPSPEAAKPRKPAPAGARPDVNAPIGIGPEALEDAELQRRLFDRIRLERARIPRRFINKSLDSFKATDPARRELLAAARRYIQGFKIGRDGEHPETELTREIGRDHESAKGLRLTGPVGCGKSHLAAGILREVVLKGYSGLFHNSPDLLSEIRATFRDNAGPSEDDLIEEISAVDLLVLDDLGAEKISDFVLDRFYLIVNKRYEACLPLIVTTNCDMETLTGRLSKRVVSRLMEMCLSMGRFPEEDYRMKSVDKGVW